MSGVLGYTYFQHAILAAVLGAVACGIIGSLIVTNRLSALAGSIAHASFGGLGLSVLIGIDPFLGASGFAMVSALGMGLIHARNRVRSDVSMAVFWATGMALGLLFIKLSGGYAVELMSWLFGSILTVSRADLIWTAGLDLVVVGVVVLMWKQLLAVSFDSEYASLQGLNVSLITSVMMMLMALTAVMLMKMIGLIMVIAMLTIPAGIARRFTCRLSRMMVLAVILAMVFGVGGLFLSTWLDLPPAATIIILATSMWGATSFRRN